MSSSLNPLIRSASAADIASCAELLGILFAQEAEFFPDPEKQRQGIAMVLDNPDTGKIFVCEINGQVRGMVMLLFTVSTFLGKKVAILEDMIVSPEFRKNRIGSQLIDYAVDYARRSGYGRITLHTDHENRVAHSFYESKGFVRSDMVIYKKQLG
jgi:GNAT superfamily N-acetyltransferase